MTRALIGSALGGLLGAALWAGIALLFQVEIGWIAWGVGCLAGFGAAKLGKDLDFSTGVAAAGVAVLAIALGKYVTVHFVVQDLAQELATADLQVDDELAISFVADEVVRSYQQEGRRLDWPGGEFPQNPTREVEYPRDVWALAAAEWSGWETSEQLAYKEQIRVQGEANLQALQGAALQAGFRESYGSMDVLFLLLAMVSAYKLGSGTAARA